MANTKNIALGLLIVAALTGFSAAATRRAPPLFRESPNTRVEIPRADDDLNYRLPNETVPMHYDVTLTTNVHDKGSTPFTGIVKIDIFVEQATNEIVIHHRQLTIEKATIQNKDDANSQVIPMKHTYELEREFLRLSTDTTPPTTFAMDSNYTLTIEYKGDLRTDNGGFYLSTFTDENGGTGYLATTQFESTDARHGFPCYDEPAKRATFTITINHDASYTAISNMPVDNSLSTATKTVFQKTVNMPTYLIAFIVSNFEYTEGVLYGLPQRIYSRPGTTHEQEWALVSGMLIVQRLAEYFDANFQLPKLDQVAVPDFAAGAMENWGLVTYREEYMLYNKDTSTVNTQTNIANIIAHEYTHQWFGNYVAIQWWMYLWLKEGFATLFSYESTDAAYPEWGIYQQFHTDEYQRAISVDAGNNPRPMTHYIQKPSEISALYDGISYSKAGCVLSMWQHALTDDVFKRGVQNYLRINQYSSANEDAFFIAVQTAAVELNYAVPAQITDMMRGWTNQGGYPLLTVTRNYDGKSFTVKQEAFFDDKTKEDNNKMWHVPINYATKSNSNFRNTEATHYLLKQPSITVEGGIPSDDWLILNKQSTGYYRINYDDRNWELISQGLIEKSHKIHPRNRAQLMNDAYRFATSERLTHAILLRLMTYLPSEDQYAPWSTANSIFSSMNRYLKTDGDYHVFQWFVADMVRNIYDKLGVFDVPGEQHYQKYVRTVAINLACMAGDSDCLMETKQKLNNLVNGGVEIEPNLQTATYCNGLKQGSDDEFNYMLNRLMTSTVQAERRILVSALGCAQNEQQLKRYVETSIDMTNQLRTQERYTILSPVYSRDGLDVCIEFLNENWLAYANLNAGFGGGNPLFSDIRGMSQYVTNGEQENKLNALIANIKNSGHYTESTDIDAIANMEVAVNANIKANREWLSANRNPILSFMLNYRSGSVSVTASFMTVSMALALALYVFRLF